MNGKEECEALMNELLPAVQSLLWKNREFYPVGAVMNTDGSVDFTSAFEERDCPDSENVMDFLTETHKELAEQKKIKASAIAYNAAMVSEKEKASIMIHLEHQDGYSVTVGLPYSFGIFKKVKYGDMFAIEGRRDIFG